MIQWISEWKFKINSEMLEVVGQLLFQANRFAWEGPFFTKYTAELYNLE